MGVGEGFGGEVGLGAVLGDDVGEADDEDGAGEGGADAPVVDDAVGAVEVGVFEVGAVGGGVEVSIAFTMNFFLP